MHERVAEAIKDEARRLLRNLRAPALLRRLKLLEILHSIQSTQTNKNSREIYYMAVNVFGSQKAVDRLIKEFVRRYSVSHVELGVSNTLKGIFIGNVTFIKRQTSAGDGAVPHLYDRMDGVYFQSQCGSTSYDNTNENLIPNMCDVAGVLCDHRVAVVVEKDTVFSRISSMVKTQGIFTDVLFICGKGYPCRNTLRFTSMMQDRARIYGLFDLDPYGLHIYAVYKYGSASAPDLRVESMERMGLGHEAFLRFKPAEDDLIPLSTRDLRVLDALDRHEELERDIALLRKLERKMEMEALLCSDNLKALLRETLAKTQDK
jgi:meiotic recombination protein SPO11